MSVQQTEGIGLLVAAFTQEEAGKAVLKAMKKAKKEKKIYFDAAAVITQDTDGDVHYSETDDMTTGTGAGWGAMVGGVIGILGGPLGIVAAAGAGALIGGIAAHGDAGFSDDSLKQLGTALTPGTSAVITVSNKDFLKMLREEVSEEDMRVAIGNLSEQIGAQLKDGKDVVRALFITEEGVFVQQVAADHDTVQVITAAVTADGVVVGEAVATPERAAYQVAVATEDGVVTETAVVTEDDAAVIDTVTTEEGTVAIGEAVVAVDESEESTDENKEA
ncbi:MAG: DUF1269 domain-containing protein [Aquificales bacterium]|nr:DUF1269 domain-containing protein [Aquificales bacterium]